MDEQEAKFQSFEEARAALQMEIDNANVENFDSKRLFAIAEQCIRLATSSDKTLQAQQNNLLRDLESARVSFNVRFLNPPPGETKEAILGKIKSGLVRSLDVLSHNQK